MRQGQLLEKQSIDKMYADTLTICPDITNVVCSRHIPTVVVQGRYDVVCPVNLPKLYVKASA
jgi:anion-transporting  ArsA/GET3 family ATPase